MNPDPSQANKREQAIILPGAAEWEVWESAPPANEYRRSQSLADRPAIRQGHPTLLALPSSCVNIQSFWLKETAPAAIAEMVTLQIEARSAGEIPVFQHAITRREAERSLVFVAALNAGLDSTAGDARATHHDLAARCYPLPADGYVLYQELGKLVLLCCGQNQLLHAQTITIPPDSATLANDLRMLDIGLQSTGIASSAPALTVWTEPEHSLPDYLAELPTHLSWPVHAAPRPAPRIPKPALDLEPPAVTLLRQSMHKKQLAKRAVIALAIVYLFIFMAMAGHLLLLQHNANSLQNVLDADAPTVDIVRNAALRWESMETAFEPEFSTLPILTSLQRTLPPDGVRLTLFSIEPYRIRVEGEAASVSAASAFAERCRGQEFLSSYTWQIPPPRVLPNNTAQFMLQGVHPNAPQEGLR